MQARFLLGAAGTGKTFRCLKEIGEALRLDPDGPPLALLAPKQATFQLERQLLRAGDPAGYTRLQIFSFERLADFILDSAGIPAPRLLSDDGRHMVLQALLARRRGELKIFRASAGLAGFARELSLELRELQRRQITPLRLRQLSGDASLREPLRHKLHDLALLLTDYLDWLRAHQAEDADNLLDLATAALRRAPARVSFAALWMDGFAEMTPQELELLAAIAPRCEKMTLAFCLDDLPNAASGSWLSIWSGIAQTFQQCQRRLMTAVGTANVVTEVLRRGTAGRFDAAPALRHLEEAWATSSTRKAPAPGEALRLVMCANPAAEATFAAREILRHVRAGGRFREVAVLVRRLDGYHDAVRQVFSRYDIPFFLDRRERVAQHPAAELTRSVLRAAAFDWQATDWFAALKTGLATSAEEDIDRLENEALKRGWKGEAWFRPLPPDERGSDWAERSRQEWIGPFSRFRSALASVKYRPAGEHLAAAIEALWADLGVEETLREWAAEETQAVHATVWEQLADWLKNLQMAFAGEMMPLREWLPILESGLAGLSVGLIPPALDQVLAGSIDRSRNPDLKLTLVLGVNETIFPAAPGAGGLFSETDREDLAALGLTPGPRRRELLARERFFGYIACTRSRQRLLLTASQRDAADQPLNPSPFFGQLQGWFAGLEVESFAGPDWREAEHPCELAALYARPASCGPRAHELARSSLGDWAKAWFDPSRYSVASMEECLSPKLAGALYGQALSTSVSRLEEFAACAFRFFVRSGLRAEERQQFEADARERGSFQHAVLARFHESLQAEGKRWRDISPDQARKRIDKAVQELLPEFREGLLASDARSAFGARALGELLQDFAATTVEWMAHYQFNPQAVELGFGTTQAPLPPWELDLGDGRRLLFRGVIDRVDLCPAGDADAALAVVIDYKSSQHKLDKLKMEHGLQLQLAAYLSVLRRLADVKTIFGVSRIVPAGVFYVNLRGQVEKAGTRTEVFREREEFQRRRFQHLGRFDFEFFKQLDASGKSGQFKIKIRADGRPPTNSTDALEAAEFSQLLDHVESELRRMGGEIYQGVIARNPYQKGSERACDRCEYLAICRFDPWENSYRVLKRAK